MRQAIPCARATALWGKLSPQTRGTRPFEGKRRAQQARRGLTALQADVPRIVMTKLSKLMPLPPATWLRDVFEMADHKAASAVIATLRGKGRMAMKVADLYD